MNKIESSNGVDSKESWRDSKPPFVLITDIEDLTFKGISDDINLRTNNFLNELAFGLRELGCPVNFNETDGLNLKDGQGMIINPVYIGSLPEELTRSLKGETRDLREALKNSLPEKEKPEDLSAIEKGKKLGVGLHPNFTNLVIFNDPDGIFSFLEGRPVIEFLRALMVKTGAWKIIALPINSEGSFGMPILGTMEQGHPRLSDLSELAFRLKVLASVKKVGGVKELNLGISADEWVNSQIVSELINLGVFLGNTGLLDPPIYLEQYLKNSSLARLISTLVRFTRQQEGAYTLWIPKIFPSQIKEKYQLGWDGVMIVTRTGSDNGMAIKTNPDYSSFVPGIPLEDGKFGKISVTDLEVGKPSVEAEEFSVPLRNFQSLYMNWKTDDKELKVQGPPIIGVVHLHRGLETFNPEKVIYQPPDLRNFPPVGCGVDAMADLSAYFMRLLVVNQWQINNFQQNLGVYYAPNHGVNIVIFPDFNNGDFYYPQNPFSSFQEAILSGDLRLSREVPQW